MRSQLAIVENDISEDDHLFETHATMVRGVLNEMQHRQDFQRTLRALDYVIAHFATLALGECAGKPPQSAWGKAVWTHLLAMADLKSHAEALEEARSIRDGLIVWDQFQNASA